MHPSTIHRRIIRLSTVSIEKLLQDKNVNEISEEIIRNIIMESNDVPRTIHMQKEAEGRTDIIIRKASDNSLFIRYELKTFFKDNETPYNYISEIIKDFHKLHQKKENEVCYFIFVCYKNKLSLMPERNSNRINEQMEFIKKYPSDSINTHYLIKDLYDECSIQIVKAFSVERESFVIYTWKVL